MPPTASVITKIDTALFDNVNSIDILNAITPLNFRSEKDKFFESNFSENPEFVYPDNKIDIFSKKRGLYELPIEELQDDDLIQMYEEVIESYTDKLDQVKSIGTAEFLYDSLRYYGEPSDKDIGNAQFILHLPDEMDPSDDELFDANYLVSNLETFAKKEGYEYNIEISDSMIANALVSGTRIKINNSARVNQKEINALCHHELGVHLVTTLNARSQPLKVASLGSPVNTTTQEGLAILCEFLSGNLSLNRLKILALRVIAVQSMIKEKDFKYTFMLLRDQHEVPEEQAFTIAARVYRGGGFTKDYLYLQGFHQMLNAYEHEENFQHLLTGKVSLEHLPLVSSLIDKGFLIKPERISPAIAKPAINSEISNFIAHAIK